MKKSIRFDKYCSQLGIFSRRTIKNVIKCQEIFCNDIKIQKPDQKIFYGDILRFGEQTIEVTDDVVILLNKPVGYVCSDEDEHYRKSYRHLIDDCCYKQMMHVAGRLDQDTEGLVILCSDGQRNHRIISPRYRCEKEYFVQLQNYCSDTDILKLQQGVRLDDGYCTLPAKVVRCGHNSIMITIVEGKYHQVKRMLEAVHNKVIFLKRLRVGDRTLDGIEQPGQRKRVL